MSKKIKVKKKKKHSVARKLHYHYSDGCYLTSFFNSNIINLFRKKLTTGKKNTKRLLGYSSNYP